MDFTRFVMPELIEPLIHLGSMDWLTFERLEDNKVKLKIILPQELHATGGEVAVIAGMHKAAAWNTSVPVWFYDVSKCLANGPKLIRPTYQQFLALENTELKIPFSLYHQPYPTVIIEVPVEYHSVLKERFPEAKIPKFVFCNHHEKEQIITSTSFFNQDDQIINLIVARPEYETIEDALQKNSDKKFIGFDELTEELNGLMPSQDQEFEVSKIVQRLGMNFCLMMTLLGIKDQGPDDPMRYTQKIRDLRSVSRKKQEKAKKALRATINVINFAQNIKFYEEQQLDEHPHGKVESDRNLPKPHWCKGHWRQQHYGENNSLVKAVFIKPVFKGLSRFTGDLKDTSVTYIAKA